MDTDSVDNDILASITLDFKNDGSIDCDVYNINFIHEKEISQKSFASLLKLTDNLFKGKLNENILNSIANELSNNCSKQTLVQFINELKKIDNDPAISPASTDLLTRL